MNRYKTYDVPHKGLRNALSQLSLLAGKTDFSNPMEVEQLYNLGDEVFKILSIHANDKNMVTLSELEQRLPGSTNHDTEDHKKLHLFQDKLEKMLSKIYTESRSGQDVTIDGTEFYLLLSEFHGDYLTHTAEEERVTQALLWVHFTDEELSSHRGKIMSINPPETLLTWFKFVIPAQTHTERVSLFTGLKKMAPEPFFKQGMETVEKVLSPIEFSQFNGALNLP